MSFFDLGLGDLVSAGAKLFGGNEAQKSAEETAKMNIAAQRDFAQHGVSWKVADAKSAGISPLAALGASTSSFSNVAGSSALGDSIGEAGQDIGRAVHAGQNSEERALTLKGAQLDIEKKGLENNILRAELASKVATRTAPGSPPASGLVFDTSKQGGNEAVAGKTGPIKVEEDSRQSLNPFGYNWKLMNTPDSQAIENRYGDPVEWVYGLANLAGDTLVNVAPHMSRWMNTPMTPQEHAAMMSKVDRYLRYLTGR